jgi:hypothetical protein
MTLRWKSSLFAGSKSGGDRAALMTALSVTAKMNEINPKEWLPDVIARLPYTTTSRMPEFLPCNWTPSERLPAP